MKNLNKILWVIIIIQFGIIAFYFIKIEKLKNVVGLGQLGEGVLPLDGQSLIDNVKFLAQTQNSLEGFNNFLGTVSEKTKFEIEPIDTAKARTIHTYYRDNAKQGDSTRAILFEWPKIIHAMDSAYNIDAGDWIDPGFWIDKGFFIYLTKYDVNSASPIMRKDQTATLFQLAALDSSTAADTTDWKVLPKTIYNFGDLRPPKKINGEEVIVRKKP